MANTVIQLKHSTVQGNVPVSLANGEISINTRDGKIFYADPTGTIQEFSQFSGPAGLNGEIQFNDSGVLGANAGLSYSKTSRVLTVVGGAIVGGINVAPQIQLSFNHANAAFITANAAFIAANNAANTNLTQNNSITAAFAAANNALNTNLTQNNSITAAFNTANGAFTRANNSLNANTGGTVTGTITATSFITTGNYGDIQGANIVYANTFVANTNGYFQFADGSRQYTANSGSSAANSFGRIYTSNNTTFANATVSTDQVTFTGVDGVSVTANATTKVITFAGTPGAQGLTVDYGLVTESIVYSLDYGTL